LDDNIEHGKSILIVDDEPEICDLISFQMQRNGFKIQTASNGKEAFELYQKSPVDLVLTDIRMPGGNGIELLDNLRKLHKHNPIVILMSGFSDLSLEEAIQKGAYTKLQKPIPFKDLTKVVMDALSINDDKKKSV